MSDGTTLPFRQPEPQTPHCPVCGSRFTAAFHPPDADGFAPHRIPWRIARCLNCLHRWENE
jgi:hypothetical protein